METQDEHQPASEPTQGATDGNVADRLDEKFFDRHGCTSYIRPRIQGEFKRAYGRHYQDTANFVYVHRERSPDAGVTLTRVPLQLAKNAEWGCRCVGYHCNALRGAIVIATTHHQDELKLDVNELEDALNNLDIFRNVAGSTGESGND